MTIVKNKNFSILLTFLWFVVLNSYVFCYMIFFCSYLVLFVCFVLALIGKLTKNLHSTCMCMYCI